MMNGRLAQLKTEHDRVAAPYVQQAQRMTLPMNEVFGEQPSGDLTPAEQAELDQLRKRFQR